MITSQAPISADSLVIMDPNYYLLVFPTSFQFTNKWEFKYSHAHACIPAPLTLLLQESATVQGKGSEERLHDSQEHTAHISQVHNNKETIYIIQ